MSSSILWCLIYSWPALLPFSKPTNTNAGAGHVSPRCTPALRVRSDASVLPVVQSILTAAEPWSGHYELNPQIYAMGERK